MIDKNQPEGSVRGAGNFYAGVAPKGSIVDISAPTVAELDAPTMKDITYSMVPGGFKWSPSYEELKDNRLTFPQERSKKGRRTDTFEIEIVYGAEDEMANKLFVEGADLDIVERRVVPHDTDFAAAQIVTVHPVTVQSNDPGDPDAEIQTRTVKFSYRLEAEREVKVAA